MSLSIDAIFLDKRSLLISHIHRLVGSRQVAEELAHESYLRVAKALRDRPIEHVQAFLFQTARNLAVDHLRRERTRRAVEISDAEEANLCDVPDDAVSTEQRVIDAERLRLFEKALSGLPKRAQQAVILNRLHGWSYPRIAAHLGVSPNTIYTDVRDAIASCLDALAEREPP